MSTQPEPPRPQEPSFLVAVARRFPGDPARQAAEIRARLAAMQARAKGDGFRTLERWLGANDLLFLRRNGCAPLVVMDFALYARLLTTGSVLEGRPVIGRGAARWKERRARREWERREARRAGEFEARQCALTLDATPERGAVECPQR